MAARVLRSALSHAFYASTPILPRRKLFITSDAILTPIRPVQLVAQLTPSESADLATATQKLARLV